jgi:uncharacterized protein YqjF (DUF2071 family)
VRLTEKVPALAGVVDRRLLINYAVDPDAIARMLPRPFRPQVHGGRAVAGICLIRLRQMRPAGLPVWTGLTSENAAHRVAVEWDSPGGTRSGVYIPRRDSDSLVNVLVGGRAFPGVHHRARFDVAEDQHNVRVSFRALDGSAEVRAAVTVADRLPASELFSDVAEASAFFERGCDGYSATRDPCRFDGLQLQTDAWSVEPAEVVDVASSFFGDAQLFPGDSAVLDNALLMRRIPVRWKSLPSLRADRSSDPAHVAGAE